MENKEIPQMTKLPGTLECIKAGFELVTEKVWLIILPVAMDLFLLFGPRLRIYQLLEHTLKIFFAQMRSVIPANGGVQLDSLSLLTLDALEQVNLFGALQTFPIGIPSLLAGSTPDKSPLGTAPMVEVSSVFSALILVVLMICVGLLLGCLYFALIANTASEDPAKKRLTPSVFLFDVLNSLLFCVALIVFLGIMILPFSCLMTTMLTVAPGLYSIVTALCIAVLGWLLVPFVFTPHAFYIHQCNFSDALKRSLSIGHWGLGLTGFFILTSVVMSLGLDLIWTIPRTDSWLILIGIFGHAVISTSLLAASFILYQKFEHWQDENQAFIQWRKEVIKARRDSLRKKNVQEQTENDRIN